jgi:hypothetical protein
MKQASEATILAVDVRRNRFAYALFEGPNQLLDWGASAFPPQLNKREARLAVRLRIHTLLRHAHPSTVAVKRPRKARAGSFRIPGPVLRTILREAANQRIPMRNITREEIRSAFCNLGGRTKDEIASILVQIFPELLTRLPQTRKVWQSERNAMIVFDAIATGFAYLRRDRTHSPPPE